jgi:hypothetical protein
MGTTPNGGKTRRGQNLSLINDFVTLITLSSYQTVNFDE